MPGNAWTIQPQVTLDMVWIENSISTIDVQMCKFNKTAICCFQAVYEHNHFLQYNWMVCVVKQHPFSNNKKLLAKTYL
jgi:hypothetical protein